MGHLQLTKQGQDGPCKLFSRTFASLGQGVSSLIERHAKAMFFVACFLNLGFESVKRVCGLSQLVQKVHERLGRIDAVLAHGAHQRIVSSFQSVQTGRVGLFALDQVVQGGGEVLHFDANAGQAFKGLVDIGVHTLQRHQRSPRVFE